MVNQLENGETGESMAEQWWTSMVRQRLVNFN